MQRMFVHDGQALRQRLKQRVRRVSHLFLTSALSVAALVLGAADASADDRDLLRESSSDPYVFILFDTSGSMNWTTRCTQAQYDAGECNYVCENDQGCAVPQNGDDPNSKFYQAKEALFEVIRNTPNINFGFATFNQDDMQVRHKHWLYVARERKPDGSLNGLVLESGRRFPAPGAEEVFGQPWSCDEVPGDPNRVDEEYMEAGCWGKASQITSMNDGPGVARFHRLPKIGQPQGHYRDELEVASFSNNDGDLFWSGPWSVYSTAAAGGEVQVTGGEMRFMDLDTNDGDSGSIVNAPGVVRTASLVPFHHLVRPLGNDPGNQNLLFTPWVELSLDYRTVGVTSSDTFVVAYCHDNACADVVRVGPRNNRRDTLCDLNSGWTKAGEITGAVAQGHKSFHVSDLGGIPDSVKVCIRKESGVSDPGEAIYVDNVEVTAAVTLYLQDPADGNRYKFVYRPQGTLPDGSFNVYGNEPFAALVEAYKCTDDAQRCDAELYARDVVYYDWPTTRVSEKVGTDANGNGIWNILGQQKTRPDFVSWDNGPRRVASRNGPNGFFSQSRAGSAVAGSTCLGWDSNDDSPADPFLADPDLNLRFPSATIQSYDVNADGTDDWTKTEGDVLFLDWTDAHENDVLARLRPSLASGPDFGRANFSVAPYLEDDRVSGELGLRVKDPLARPLLPEGSTPLGDSIKDFRTWYLGCDTGGCRRNLGWEDVGKAFDVDFNCRKKFLLVLTDGDESCGGGNSACSGTAGLRAQAGIRTFVVGFGVPGGGNTLTCMAANGGTGKPIFPQNKAELVAALENIFGEIQVQARSFAAASVPTVQSETADKIYLSNFTPLPQNPVWPGEITAFRKPLPLLTDGTPDFDRLCVDSANGLVRQSGCVLWDAAEILKTQAPVAADLQAILDAGNPLTPADLKLGTSLNERRVLYGTRGTGDAVPTDLRLFAPPPAPGAVSPSTTFERDLWDGLGISFTVGDLVSEGKARSEATWIVKKALEIKIPVDSNGVRIKDALGNDVPDFVMGDVFHADPLVLGSPQNLLYFRQDLHGYQGFERDHFWRRKMLVIAANDGQLHFFDAGTRIEVTDASGTKRPVFNDGTGRELFAYVPRLSLPAVRHQAASTKHVYSLDGTPAVGDVWVDPLHGGNPAPADRGWRSVLVTGFREGGDIFQSTGIPLGYTYGYFALDVTQPDKLIDDPDDATRKIPDPLTNGLPSCLSIDFTDGTHRRLPDCKTPAGSNFPFPVNLWTFRDQVPASAGIGSQLFDEEDADLTDNTTVPLGNGLPDLGETWSKPVIGRIQVCKKGGLDCEMPVGTDLEERYVAIFGGGVDPTSPNSSDRGAFLYMVDMETGRALYKRQVTGGIAGAPAVIDVDRDAFFDVVYVATTAGWVYKVDLRTPAGDDVPVIEELTLDNDSLLGSPLSAGATFKVDRVVDLRWEPFPIFNSGGRPFYMSPTLFLVPGLDQYAFAIGTGDRENLWNLTGEEARFYTIVDEDYERADFLLGAGATANRRLPRVEADYAPNVFPADGTANNTDFLVTSAAGGRGWIMRLGVDERVITDAFVVVGVVIFTSFDPDPEVVDPNAPACARSGVSKIFVVDGESGDAFVDLDLTSTASTERFITVGDFTTAPYLDQTATKNPDPGDTEKTTQTIDDLTQDALQEAIRQALMRFFPEGCRFNKSYSLLVNGSRSDTGHVRYATIPIAMCPVDWKEE